MDADEVKTRLAGERERLEALRASFDEAGLGDARESEEVSLSELSTIDQHQADVGTEMFHREADLSILEQVEAELVDVERALERLEAGTYGTCEACGRPIGEERLEALPATRFCVDDQAQAEREARVSMRGEEE